MRRREFISADRRRGGGLAARCARAAAAAYRRADSVQRARHRKGDLASRRSRKRFAKRDGWRAAISESTTAGPPAILIASGPTRPKSLARRRRRSSATARRCWPPFGKRPKPYRLYSRGLRSRRRRLCCESGATGRQSYRICEFRAGDGREMAAGTERGGPERKPRCLHSEFDRMPVGPASFERSRPSPRRSA